MGALGVKLLSHVVFQKPCSRSQWDVLSILKLVFILVQSARVVPSVKCSFQAQHPRKSQLSYLLSTTSRLLLPPALSLVMVFPFKKWHQGIFLFFFVTRVTRNTFLVFHVAYFPARGFSWRAALICFISLTGWKHQGIRPSWKPSSSNGTERLPRWGNGSRRELFWCDSLRVLQDFWGWLYWCCFRISITCSIKTLAATASSFHFSPLFYIFSPLFYYAVAGQSPMYILPFLILQYKKPEEAKQPGCWTNCCWVDQ